MHDHPVAVQRQAVVLAALRVHDLGVDSGVMIDRATCQTCSAKTERRELPSGAAMAATDSQKVVSYWCPQCRQWEATDERPTDAPTFLDRMTEAPPGEHV